MSRQGARRCAAVVLVAAVAGGGGCTPYSSKQEKLQAQFAVGRN